MGLKTESSMSVHTYNTIQYNTIQYNTNDLLSKVHVHGDLSLSAQNINLKNLRKLKIIT